MILKLKFKYIASILLTFIWFATYAQNQAKIDSLRMVYRTTKTDSGKIRNLLLQGNEFLNALPDSSAKLYRKAVNIAESKGQKNLEFEARIGEAKAIGRAGKQGEAIIALQALLHELTNISIRSSDKEIDKLTMKTHGALGDFHKTKGDASVSLHHYKNEIQLAENLKEWVEYINGCNSIAQSYYLLGKFSEALDYCLKAVTMSKKIGNDELLGSSLGNTGIIFKELKDFEKARKYFQEALDLNRKLNNKSRQGINLGNIGVTYASEKNYQKAVDYYKLALALHEELGNTTGLIYNYENIGRSLQNMGRYTEALINLEHAHQIAQSKADEFDISYTTQGLASYYIQVENFTKAQEFISAFKEMSQSFNSLKSREDYYTLLFDFYHKQNMYKEALNYHQKLIEVRDSLKNEDITRRAIQLESDQQYRSRYVADSVAFAKSKELDEAALAKQKAEFAQQEAELKAAENQKIALYGGIGLVVLFAGFVFSRLRITRKQNSLIKAQSEQVRLQKEASERQKAIIEQKQKEILDSINYAKRLQNAFMVSEDEIRQFFPNCFIYYQPKDVLAGDFYLLEQTSKSIYLAVADCTGHGVPGAMLSIVCAAAIRRSIFEFNKRAPGEILDQTRTIITETFAKSGSDVRDGMDVSLIAIEKQSHPETGIKLQWAGANNPLWMIRSKTGDSGSPSAQTATNMELIELKPDKQPIGKYESSKPFTTHQIELKACDRIFLLTDGYSDQFGGESEHKKPGGRKYKQSRLQNLLLSNANASLTENGSILKTNFENWKGDLEQIDDVCIIGIQF